MYMIVSLQAFNDTSCKDALKSTPTKNKNENINIIYDS